MKKPSKLKLHAVGNKMINDLEALHRGISRYIGRKWDGKLKGFPPTAEPSVVNTTTEYVKLVQQGDLAPADEETAKYCGVPFTQHQSEITQVSDTHPYTGKY
jgi:hypothetical protein